MQRIFIKEFGYEENCQMYSNSQPNLCIYLEHYTHSIAYKLT